MFFEGYTAEQLIIGLVGLAIAVTQALFPQVSLLELIKKYLKLEGQIMHFVVIGFFMALSALAMWITNEWSGVEWTLQAWLEYFGWFYAIAQIAYQKLKAG